MANPAERLCLLTVHAHPDDEASKGAPTVARYHAEGIRTVLVCCTGGEEGEILNPALDDPSMADKLAEIRAAELARAAEVIGYEEVEMLGYRDSGMEGSEANNHPDCFARADLEEAVARLVVVIRRQRPHVIVTYPEDQGGYMHPDHIRVHDVSMPAYERAGDPAYRPDLGEPWAPAQALLHPVVAQAHRGAPPGVPGSRPGIAVQRVVVQAAVHRLQDHHSSSRGRVHRRPHRRDCWPTPPRSTRNRRSGSGCPPRSSGRSIHTTTMCWPGGPRPATLPERDLFEGLRPEPAGDSG